MTPAQTRLIHIARRAAGLNDAAYRTLLRSVAGVASSTQLSNAAFEQVMAVLEQQGFTDSHHGPGYWQKKAGREADGAVSDRQIRMIETMAVQAGYALAGFVLRMTRQRTADPVQLTAEEANDVISAFKSILARKEAAAKQAAQSLFPHSAIPDPQSAMKNGATDDRPTAPPPPEPVTEDPTAPIDEIPF